MRNSSGELIGSFDNWHTTPLGSGGFVTGIALAAQGGKTVMMTCNDVTIGFDRTFGDPGEWRKLMRLDNMPVGEHSPTPTYYARRGDNAGQDLPTYAAAFAPSDPDFRVISANGRIWYTEDATGTWTLCSNLIPLRMEANQGFKRHTQTTIAIHPTDVNTWLIGTDNDGVWVTTDKGVSWTEIASIPSDIAESSNPDRKHYVAVDPTDPTIWYAHSHTNGVYRSTTGASGPYSLMTGSPTTCSQISVCPTSGDLFVNKWRDATGNKLFYYDKSGDAWVECSPTTQSIAFAIDPFDQNHIVCIGENGNDLSRTLDKNATDFVVYSDVSRGDGEIAWFSNTDKALFISQINFDPVVPGRLWASEGIGVSYFDTPATNAGTEPWRWHDYSQGIEMLIAYHGAHNPATGNEMLLCWDKALWEIKDEFNFTNIPEAATNDGITRVTIGAGWDYAIDDPTYQVLACSPPNTTQAIGWRQGDQTEWQVFDTPPPSTRPVADPIEWAGDGTTTVFNYTTSDGMRIGGASEITVEVVRVGGAVEEVTFTQAPTQISEFVFDNYEGTITVDVAPTVGETLRVTKNNGNGYYNNVAVSNAGQILLLNSGNGCLMYTDDGGADGWQLVGIGPEDPFGYNHLAYYVKRQVICADKQVPGDFYLLANDIDIRYGTVGRTGVAGLWRLRRQSDGTLQPTQLVSGLLNAGVASGTQSMFWQAKLMCVPGYAGEVVFAQTQGNPSSNGNDCLVWWDGTQQREINSAFRGVIGYAFGPPAPGQSRPSLGVYCTNGPSGEGLYVTLDWGATVELVTTHVDGEIIGVEYMHGNASTFGRFYLGIVGSGWRTSTYAKKFTIS